MEDFLLGLNILETTLAKKEKDLVSILNISVNQETVFKVREESGNEELSEFNKQMNFEKQILIDEVLKTDEIFNNTFYKIRKNFEKNAVLHKTEIKNIQEKIKMISHLDVSIRRQEQINKNISSTYTKLIKWETSKVQKEYILKQYSINSRKK